MTVWDLPTGATLATLPVTGDAHRVLFDASGAVLTEVPALLRWPVAEAPDGAATIGPPQILQPRGTQDGFAITQDGRTIAAAMYNDGGLVFDAQNPQRARWLRPHRDVRYIAISPDGRWVVTGSHGVADGMKLWDAQTGRLVHDFPGVSDEVGLVRSFSPDGRWLAVHWDGWVLFETTTWTPKVRLFRGVSSGLAFAPDSRTAVYDDDAGTLILVEVETGRELARLEDPEQARIDAVAFTPDGSQLVTTLLDRPYLRVWDLRAIRRRLAELRLDWDPPATFDTPDAPGSFPPIPKPFRVDRGQLDSWLRQTAEPPEQIVERMTRAIEANPDDSEAHHQRGHALFQLKRFDEAIADFTAALKARPGRCPPAGLTRPSRKGAGSGSTRLIADGEAATPAPIEPAQGAGAGRGHQAPGPLLQRPGLDPRDRPRLRPRPGPRLRPGPAGRGIDTGPGDLPQHARRRPLPRRPPHRGRARPGAQPRRRQGRGRRLRPVLPGHGPLQARRIRPGPAPTSTAP